MKIMSQYWYQTHHYYRIPRNILTLFLGHRGDLQKESFSQILRIIFGRARAYSRGPHQPFPRSLPLRESSSNCAPLSPRVQASNECQRFARYDITRWRFQTIWDCVRREIFPSRGTYRGQFCDSCRRYPAPVFSAPIVQLWLRVYE